MPPIYFGLGQILYLLKSYVEKNMLNNDSFETEKVMEFGHEI